MLKLVKMIVFNSLLIRLLMKVWICKEKISNSIKKMRIK